MDVTTLEWTITIAATVAVLLFDVAVIARNPHEPTMRECAIALTFYIGAALAFGAWTWLGHGQEYGLQFYTGWLTEYSLSIDNLFVFLLLMAALKVPRQFQQQALMVGIVLALLFRAVFIALGYALIENFSWVFYVFGAFLVWTAVKLARSRRTHEEEHPEDNAIVAFTRSHLRVGERYDGLRLWYRENGVRFVSPMVVVIVALGATDILFALDSIPAIFGVTREPYLVFTANVFALMGLRQLYFLLGGLLQKLVYLSLGLAVILAFIGVKLVLHALHENELSFVNGGEPLHVPEVPSLLSLGVIVVTLVVTAVASLWRARRQEEREGAKNRFDGASIG
ncbi:TerC family protein [Nocardioides sp. J54]|uniref:TerC family protein n=1 Tax=Nocardioides sp. J54 TaxID=935866 RepID=UPI0004BA5ABC|nr:TerC family protein [Nocardioides sp. J54]